MEFSEIVTPLICATSPFAFGWILLSVLIGIRGGWEGGLRFFLLGLGLLGAVLALGAILVFLPDWAVVTLTLVGALFPWVIALRYLVMAKLSGKLLLALPQNDQKQLMSMMTGVLLVMLGTSQFSSRSDFFSPVKSYALGLSLISLGIFRAIHWLQHTQIREKGILASFGNCHRWENIESYTWKFGEDKLSLKLREAFLNHSISLKVQSQLRQEAMAYLSQKIDDAKNNAPGYIPIQKAG